MLVRAPRIIPVDINYRPRPHFRPFHARKQRWSCIIAHRRAGKTVAALNDLIKCAVTENKPDGRYAFIFPFRGQAKDTAWRYLKRYAAPLLGAEPSESELRVELRGGQMIRLYGADNPDSLRGPYLDGGVLDEFADMYPEVWTEVMRPMLADRKGWAAFIGTAKGKNAFYDIWQRAQKDPENWYSVMLKASETGILDAAELADMRHDMGEDQYMQEMECSFEAATKGAFYGDELRIMLAEGRIRPLPIVKDCRVHTGWDIGRTDSTAIWFIQCVGRERRLVDYHESSGRIITWYADLLHEKKREHGWTYGEHHFPHDMSFHMLDSDKSRIEMMREKGVDGNIVPAHDVLEGINVTRRMLPHVWIDPVRCERGLEALKQYRRAWDAKLNDWKPTEFKDWTNHGADALRTFAAGFDDPEALRPKGERRRQANSGGPSPWAA